MKNKVKYIVTLSLAFFSIPLMSKENVENPNATSVVNIKVAAGCSPSTSKTDLDVNNVRTIIMGGGDMWWNLDDARYEIPKDGNKHSMFAGSLWIGGVDAGGQLKVAAMTYRQSGNDFWPGPLNTENNPNWNADNLKRSEISMEKRKSDYNVSSEGEEDDEIDSPV